MRYFKIVTLLALVMGIGLQPAVCADQSHDGLCGPRALLDVCRAFKVSSSLQELTKLSEYKGQGVSLGGLAKAATAKGLNAQGRKASIEQLIALDAAKIAYLWSGHFVVVKSAPSNRVEVINSGIDSETMGYDAFKDLYSGYALLVTRKGVRLPPAAQLPVDMRLSSYSWRFGTVERGSKLVKSISIRNQGKKPLTITYVSATRDIIGAAVSPSILAPGRSGIVKLECDTSELTGDQAHTVFLTSNDSAVSTVQLRVTGRVVPADLCYSPRALNLGAVEYKSVLERHVFIAKPELHWLALSHVASNNPYVTAKVVRNLTPPGFDITVRLAPNAPLGKTEAVVTVASNHRRTPTIRIPLSATVCGPVAAEPEGLYFGYVGQDALMAGAEKYVVLACSNHPFRVLRVDSPCADVRLSIVTSPDQSKHTITAHLQHSVPRGPLFTEARVQTDSPVQPLVRVPIMALIAD